MPSTLFTRRLAAGLLGVLATSATVAVAAPAASASSGSGGSSLSIQYSDCTEYIGFEWVPRATAAELLPDDFETVFGYGSFGTPPPDTAQVIVRTVVCGDVVVAGRSAGEVTLAQIGIVTALADAENVDPTPFNGIDNYQLEYVTDSPRLASRLNAAGVEARVDRNLSMTVTPADPGFVSVAIDAHPRFTTTGTQADTSPYPGFVADWWGERDGHGHGHGHGHGGDDDYVRARQVITEIGFGFFGSVTMQAGPASVLHDIFGDAPVDYDVSLLGRFASGPQTVQRATPGS